MQVQKKIFFKKIFQKNLFNMLTIWDMWGKLYKCKFFDLRSFRKNDNGKFRLLVIMKEGLKK